MSLKSLPDDSTAGKIYIKQLSTFTDRRQYLNFQRDFFSQWIITIAKPCTGLNCGVNIPHIKGFYFHRSHDIVEDINMPWDWSNPPPEVWAAFQRTGVTPGPNCWRLFTIDRDQQPETAAQAAAGLRADFVLIANFLAYHTGYFSDAKINGRREAGFHTWASMWRQSAQGHRIIQSPGTIFCGRRSVTKA